MAQQRVLRPSRGYRCRWETAGIERLARYLLRAPVAVERMELDAAAREVLYRPRQARGSGPGPAVESFAAADFLAVDPLTCRQCGGHMRILAFIQEPAAIRKILAHLDCQRRHPSRAPPEQIPAPTRAAS